MKTPKCLKIFILLNIFYILSILQKKGKPRLFVMMTDIFQLRSTNFVYFIEIKNYTSKGVSMIFLSGADFIFRFVRNIFIRSKIAQKNYPSFFSGPWGILYYFAYCQGHMLLMPHGWTRLLKQHVPQKNL